MTTTSLVEPVLKALHALLKPRGFTKSGPNFRWRGADAIGIVSLQRSMASTAGCAKVTVNLGVYIPALQDPQRPQKNPSVWSSHWRERLGYLMPEKCDIWWSIQTLEESCEVAAVLVRGLEQHGLPALSSLSSVAALRRLWESGQCHGLTDYQRAGYLAQMSEMSRA